METLSPDSTGFTPAGIGESTLFEDRLDAGRRLAPALVHEVAADALVLALSHGGIEVAAEVARTLHAPLDILVVRKIRYPGAPQRVLGAVAPGYAVYVHTRADLSARRLAIAAADARVELEHVDKRLHAERPQLDVKGREVLLLDDGATTGARMITATRWARTQRARRIVAAVPIASTEAAERIREEVDEFVCPHELAQLGAVGIWYEQFDPVHDDDVLRVLDETEADVAEAIRDEAHGHRLHIGHRRRS
jgi:putative phosphoribosyl transferase